MSESFKLRGIERFREAKREWDIPEGIIEKLIPLPDTPIKITSLRDIMRLVIMGGVSEGKGRGQWYRVTFPIVVRDPTVVAVAESKGGTIKERTIDKIESVRVKTISRITTSEGAIRDRVKRELGDWGWAANWMRDAIATAFGKVLYWVHRMLIQPQTDKVQDAINSTIGDFNSKIDRQIDRVTSRTNFVLKDLYSMWGIPSNLAIAPVHIRNVKSTGFEWLSLGDMKVHWLTVGLR